jgi:curved DNA-binding protein CbpA
VTEARLKRRYKSLAKRWHPDRFQADPVGQAEASENFRHINHAYEVVADSLRTAEFPQSFPKADVADRPFSLSREQIDAIVDSINRRQRVSLLPEMSVHRWLSVAAALAYLIGAVVVFPSTLQGRRTVGEMLVYLLLPLYLIWTGDKESLSSFESLLYRVFGWLLMALPAIVMIYWIIF